MEKNYTKSALILQCIALINPIIFMVSWFFGETNEMAFILFFISFMTLGLNVFWGIWGLVWMSKAKKGGEQGAAFVIGWILSIFNTLIGMGGILIWCSMLLSSVL